MSNKSLLEELCVQNGWCKPNYSTTKQGPDHVPQFTSTVVVNDVSFKSQGSRGSKKESEASAAGAALEKHVCFQSRLPLSPNLKSLSTPVKVCNVSRSAGRLTWKDTNTTPPRKNKGADEKERLLDQERKIWNNEKRQLELKNLESANTIEVKSNENQQLEKKLLYMKDMEQRKTERLNSLLEEKQRENEKLHMEVAEMKKRLQAVTGDVEEGKKNLGFTESSTKEQSYKDEHEEIRKVLIKALYGSKGSIGVKILGDLDWKVFQYGANREYCVKDELNVRAKELCAIWESHIGDPHWKPFKTITDTKGKNKEIIDEGDEKLRKLKMEQGDIAYLAVITALLETKEYNRYGGFKVEELWNFTLGRKATLMEAVQYLLKQPGFGNTNKRLRN